MSYEPYLIVKKSDLMEFEEEIHLQSHYEPKGVDEKVLKYLDDTIKNHHDFELRDEKWILLHPELTSFNKQVREYLDDKEIEYSSTL